jgi:hypothetical protein
MVLYEDTAPMTVPKPKRAAPSMSCFIAWVLKCYFGIFTGINTLLK